MSDAAKPMTASEREALIAKIRERGERGLDFWCGKDEKAKRESTMREVADARLDIAAAAELSRLGKIEERLQKAVAYCAKHRKTDLECMEKYFVRDGLLNDLEAILKGAADDA